MVLSTMKSAYVEDRKRAAVDKTLQGTKRVKSGGDFKLKQLTGFPNDFTRTNDEIHTTIDLCPVMKAFIDTSQFQRLRGLNQLGTSSLVYINANHSRFEHSLGVAHLAKMLCSRIKLKQPGLETTDKDVLCVTLAGLLHDIGHGPFSHVYELFREEIANDLEEHPEKEELYSRFPPVPDDWKHESSSLAMIDAILKSHGLAISLDEDKLDLPLIQIGDGIDANYLRVFENRTRKDRDGLDSDDVLTSRDLVFIKECIWGGPIPEARQRYGDVLIGRKEAHKEWLYGIVANKFSGLDVDKIDYLARDRRRAFGSAGSIDIQAQYEAVVAKAKCGMPGCLTCKTRGFHFMICYPEKTASSIMRFFRRRFEMHQKVYQHKTTAGAAFMVSDILRAADLHFLIHGRELGALPISRALLDQDAFLKLDDSIIRSIRLSPSEELTDAKNIIKRLLSRENMYKCKGERVIKVKDERDVALWAKDENEIAREIVSIGGSHNDENGNSIKLEFADIIVEKCKMDHGCKDKNPLARVRFVQRDDRSRLDGPIDDIPEAKEVDESDHDDDIPRSFQRKCIRVFSRDPAKDDLLQHVFCDWLEKEEAAQNTPTGGFQVLHREEASDGDDSAGEDFGRGHLLTQDSEDEATPVKHPPRDQMDFSPIPMDDK